MSPDAIATLGAPAIIVVFLWNLHRVVAGPGERMARLEGNMEVLVGFLIDRETKQEGGQSMIPVGDPGPRASRDVDRSRE